MAWMRTWLPVLLALATTCAAPGQSCCDGSELPEQEACGDDTNGGCNSTPPAFEAVECGSVTCGTAWLAPDPPARDTDWYLISLADPDGSGMQCLRARSFPEFPATTLIVDGIATCRPLVVGDVGCSEFCVVASDAFACLPAPAEYVVFVAPGDCAGPAFGDIPCGTTSSYRLEIECVSDVPVNDDCAGAINVAAGATPFNSTGATTDGPSPCGLLGSDIWFEFEAELSGTLRIDTCGSGFDTVIAVYDGCGCKADITGDGVVDVDDLVALVLDWLCAGGPGECLGDIDDSGRTDVEDLVELILAWGPCGPCPGESLISCNDDCTGQVEPCEDLSSCLFLDVVAGACYRIQVGGFNGASGSGVLVIEHSDPSTCCRGDEISEAEACGDDANGGCNSSPPAFEPVECGDVVCGTFWAEDGVRDTDWYLVSLSNPNAEGFEQLRGRLSSDAWANVLVTTGIAECRPIAHGFGETIECTTVDDAFACLESPGEYVLFVALVFEGPPGGQPCETTPPYRLEVICDACPP